MGRDPDRAGDLVGAPVALRIAAAAGDGTETAATAASLTDPHSTPPTTIGQSPHERNNRVAPGTQVGRFVVLGELGAGGMGVVYAAYDPDLDRKVALKQLHVLRQDERGLARALREAQAMAKLNHPNVVAVYEVGTHNDAIYIAMELVEGVTFREWIRSEKRSWRDVLAVMVQAGRGLVAAHEAGIVHRDIKPSNILVDGKERARVTDFGIAAASGAASGAAADGGQRPAPPIPLDSSLSTSLSTGRSAFDEQLTRTGAMVGTPAYMAPEQGAGLGNELSDQYSFCVTLYEGLFGTRPYRGQERASVPKWLRQVVLRGLSPAATARYPSMQALVAELERDRRSRRRRMAGAAAVVVALVGGVALGSRGGGEPPICAGAADAMAATWNSHVRAAVGRAFRASGRSHAEQSLKQVQVTLDRYASAWAAMAAESCAATRVRGAQSERVFDLRMRCLERRRAELAAMLALFTAADAQVVDEATNASGSLVQVASCADVESLEARVPPPEDPAVRARVAAVRADLDRVEALTRTGKVRDALPAAVRVAQDSREVEYWPLRADALASLAEAQAQAGDYPASEQSWWESIEGGSRARDDALVARAWAALIGLIGDREAKPADALRWERAARAAVVRAGDGVEYRALLANSLGASYHEAGNYKEAKAQYEQALVGMAEALAPTDPRTVRTRGRLGLVLQDMGLYSEARALFERTLSEIEASLGPDHPNVAVAANNLGRVLLILGEYDAAKTNFDRALSIWLETLGPEHPFIALTHNNLGAVLGSQGKFAEAQVYFERAAAAWEKALGPKHARVAMAAGNLGDIARHLKQYDKAREQYQKAIRIIEAAQTRQHPQVAGHLAALAAVERADGRWAAAIADLEEAVAIRQANELARGDLGDARLSLADTLWASGKQRRRAVGLARAAREDFAAAGADWQAKLAEADKWLLAHAL